MNLQDGIVRIHTLLINLKGGIGSFIYGGNEIFCGFSYFRVSLFNTTLWFYRDGDCFNAGQCLINIPQLKLINKHNLLNVEIWKRITESIR